MILSGTPTTCGYYAKGPADKRLNWTLLREFTDPQKIFSKNISQRMNKTGFHALIDLVTDVTVMRIF